MRSRRSSQSQVAEVARRRLELLSAELAGLRPTDPVPPSPDEVDRAGELTDDTLVPARATGRHALRPVSEVEPPPTSRLGDRWVPSTLRGSVELGVHHLAVVALGVLVAVGATAWFVHRAGSGTELPDRAPAAAPARPPSALVTPAPAGSAAPAPGQASVSPTGEVVVDVAGKVRRPGIVTLPLGSRVVDAVHAAGGARARAALAGINLARVLVDGEQVLVGATRPQGVAGPAAAAPSGSGTAGAGPASLVNLNTADQSALEELPGVGPVTAQSILRYRDENGPFAAVDELLEVSGIGDKTLAELAPFVTL